MREVFLQHLVPPDESRITKELYYHGEDFTFIRAGGSLDLRTFFNSIPVYEYRVYCGIRHFKFHLCLFGNAAIEVHLSHEDGSETVVESTEFDAKDVVFAGIVIRAVSDCRFYGGSVSCCAEPIDVELAVCVCTYHREEEVHKKIALLKGFVKLVVVDNGSTLDDVPGVDVLHSRNYGGSAGFTFALMEALKDPGVTHIVLNDDDALLFPETVHRMKTFLSLVLPEYRKLCICGTMLDIDHTDMIVESGAKLTDSGNCSFGKGLKVSDVIGCLGFPRKAEVQYSGWYLSVFPRCAFSEFGLPLPLFFKYDDVEFGSRLDYPKISLPGVAVWHKDFCNRYNPSDFYYTERNFLVTHAVRGTLSEDIIKNVTDRILLNITGYRYDAAEYSLLGLIDFLKGPDFVYNQCKKGKIKNDSTTELILLSNIPKDVRKEPVRLPSYYIRKYTFNGALFPSKGTGLLDIGDLNSADFYGLRRIVYPIGDDKCLVAEKDLFRTIKLTLKVLRIKRSLLRELSDIQEQYRVSFYRYSSPEFWDELFYQGIGKMGP